MENSLHGSYFSRGGKNEDAALSMELLSENQGRCRE